MTQLAERLLHDQALLRMQQIQSPATKLRRDRIMIRGGITAKQ